MRLSDLSQPFPPDRISWRVGSANADKTKGMALAYIDARDVMQRLDEVCQDQWQAEYVPMPNGTCCCRIGIKVGGDWVWRSNGSVNITDSDKADQKEMAEKGSYSDAFKRAAVLWGVGRYLYDLDSPWVALEPAGRSYKIKESEYPRLRRLLGNVPSPAPIQQPEDESQERDGSWPIMVPGQDQPYTRVTTPQLWVQEMNDMAARIRNSTKVPDLQKAAKLDTLRKANESIIEQLPDDQKFDLNL